MILDTLNRLLSVKNRPCLSVIVPQYRLSRERMQNPELFRKAIRKAKSILKRNPSAQGQLMMEKLEGLIKAYKPDYSMSGVGLFVSTDISEILYFPFDVNERIIHDTSFETRDLLYLKQLLSTYYVLVLGKKSVSLYSASGNELMEIRDGFFPAHYEEEYEYARPSLGTSFGKSLKAFEKDKSIVNKARVESFYKEAGNQLTTYLNRNSMPLLISGTKKHIADFYSATHLKEKVAAEISGSFSDKNFFDLRTKAWNGYVKFNQAKAKVKIKELEEKDTPHKLAKGIQEVWQASHEGRGLHLMVEKDYFCKSYLRDGDPVLYLNPPKVKYTLVPDAVDEIIETVLEKGGRIEFMEERALKRFDSIALLLRY